MKVPPDKSVWHKGGNSCVEAPSVSWFYQHTELIAAIYHFALNDLIILYLALCGHVLCVKSHIGFLTRLPTLACGVSSPSPSPTSKKKIVGNYGNTLQWFSFSLEGLRRFKGVHRQNCKERGLFVLQISTAWLHIDPKQPQLLVVCALNIAESLYSRATLVTRGLCDFSFAFNAQ